MRLKPVNEGIWVVEEQSSPLGIELGLRMTVVRLKDGSLWVHSPVRMTSELKAELDAIGPVRHVVAPNLFHHLYVRSCREAFPEARFYAAPGLPEKRKNFTFDEVLSEEVPAAWANQIDQAVLKGAPKFNEVVFRHVSSRTLIVTDLAFNLHHVEKFCSRLFYKVWGVYRKFGPSRLVRFLIKDRGEFKRSMNPVFGWEFDRVIVAHGDILESGGKEAFQISFNWL